MVGVVKRCPSIHVTCPSSFRTPLPFLSLYPSQNFCSLPELWSFPLLACFLTLGVFLYLKWPVMAHTLGGHLGFPNEDHRVTLPASDTLSPVSATPVILRPGPESLPEADPSVNPESSLGLCDVWGRPAGQRFKRKVELGDSMP